MVGSLLGGLRRLGDVALLFLAFFLIFGVLGIQVFSGPYLHSICRLTPYPVNISWAPGIPTLSCVSFKIIEHMLSPGSDFSPFKCLDAPTLSLVEGKDISRWSKATSPWSTPQADCHWPG